MLNSGKQPPPLSCQILLQLAHDISVAIFFQEIYKKLEHKKTKTGYTLDLCIPTGVDNPAHPFIYTVGTFTVLYHPS